MQLNYVFPRWVGDISIFNINVKITHNIKFIKFVSKFFKLFSKIIQPFILAAGGL